jgi:L-asparaginase
MNAKILSPVLIIHGGAGQSFRDKRRAARVRKKIRKILNRAHRKLSETNALEAVVYAVALLENDPEFNAGTGSMLQADGKARLSASVMDGSRNRFAGVVNIERIKNPVLVARRLLDQKSRVLAGPGAHQFARMMDFKPKDPRTKQSIRRWKKRKEQGSDTVGACALDRFGNLAAATSTGGRGWERSGRVSDSCMPVSNFADKRCAVSATGNGEDIIDEGIAIRIVQRVEDGMTLDQATQKTFRTCRARKRSIGVIGLDRKGNVVTHATTELLIYGWQTGKRVNIF